MILSNGIWYFNKCCVFCRKVRDSYKKLSGVNTIVVGKLISEINDSIYEVKLCLLMHPGTIIITEKMYKLPLSNWFTAILQDLLISAPSMYIFPNNFSIVYINVM